MTENIGPHDRTIRALLSVGLAALATLVAGDLRVAAPAAFGSVWLAGTVITGRCPVYTFLRSLRRSPIRRRP